MFSSTKNSAPFWHPPKPNLGDIASHPFGSYPKQQISDLVVLAVNPFGSILSSVSKGVYRHGFGGHEKDNEVKGSGNWYAFGDYGYDPRVVQRPSPDPLAAKHPYESPYVVFGGNPIIYIDPDGREKIIALDKDKDKTIIAGAEKYTDDGAIHIFGHGSSKGMSLVMDGKKYTIRTAKQLDNFLSKHSETWQNKKDGDKPMIVLHSCNTGRDGKDGSASFAQKISESETFKDATIIAPNERVYFSESGEIGAYKAKYANEDGEYKRDEQGEIKSKAKSETPGSWRVFQGGKQTGQYRGDWKPKEEPTFMDKFTKKEEVK
jgi:hypothetical protein